MLAQVILWLVAFDMLLIIKWHQQILSACTRYSIKSYLRLFSMHFRMSNINYYNRTVMIGNERKSDSVLDTVNSVHLTEKCCCLSSCACHWGRIRLCVGDNANTCLMPSTESIYNQAVVSFEYSHWPVKWLHFDKKSVSLTWQCPKENQTPRKLN